MIHAVNSTAVGNASVDACGAWRTIGTLGVVSIILAPIAAWQFGVAGACLVAALAVVIAATGWIAHRLEARIVRSGHAVAGLLAASGVRMAVPLLVALLCVTMGGRFVPVSSVLLLVPLYLSALWLDTTDHVRRPTNRAGFNASWLPPVGSTRRGQG